MLTAVNGPSPSQRIPYERSTTFLRKQRGRKLSATTTKPSPSYWSLKGNNEGEEGAKNNAVILYVPPQRTTTVLPILLRKLRSTSRPPTEGKDSKGQNVTRTEQKRMVSSCFSLPHSLSHLLFD
mmetsp:Transcript_15417/g.31291  ORF Transcript_15417/g.31291 Transcript_15417/m.31291 type:complete len:124 (-) Transcript_15417:677-1048(-)